MHGLRQIIKKALGVAYRVECFLIGMPSDSLSVFVFHEITDKPSPFASEYDLYTSVATFRLQMSWICENFNVIHPQSLSRIDEIRSNAAVITFDDGFLGVFENALPILKEMGIPSIVFLNMQPIVQRVPLLSATIGYLRRSDPHFCEFIADEGLFDPVFLDASPTLLELFQQKYGPINNSSILDYQGVFVDLDTLKYWNDSKMVVYGNHLFQHWNARALSESELTSQYLINEQALGQLNNRTDFFAFTYGQIGSCWNDKDAELITKLGATSVFSSTGKMNRINGANDILDRIGLSELENQTSLLWFRLARAAWGKSPANLP